MLLFSVEIVNKGSVVPEHVKVIWSTIGGQAIFCGFFLLTLFSCKACPFTVSAVCVTPSDGKNVFDSPFFKTIMHHCRTYEKKQYCMIFFPIVCYYWLISYGLFNQPLTLFHFQKSYIFFPRAQPCLLGDITIQSEQTETFPLSLRSSVAGGQ